MIFEDVGTPSVGLMDGFCNTKVPATTITAKLTP